MPNDRPLPYPDPGTAPYWNAAKEHALMLPRCTDCGKFHSYPRALCPFCSSARIEWKACSGRGSIYTFTEVFRAPSKGFASEVPYIVGIVQLEEGPHLMTKIVRAGDRPVAIGERVTVSFEDVDEQVSLPVFKVTPP